MAALIIGEINFKGVFTRDLFDVSFDVKGIDLNSKTALCQVRKADNTPVVVEFDATDGSLVLTPTSTTLSTLRLVRSSKYMYIEPGKYLHSIIVFTAGQDDVQTIATGYFEIIPQVTIKV